MIQRSRMADERLRPVVLAANPSFSHELEARMWRQLAAGLRRKGWQLLKHSARKIEDGPNTIVIPARLVHLDSYFPPLFGDKRFRLPAWLDHETVQLLIEWEHRRWRLGSALPAVHGGLTKLAWHVDQIVSQVRPAVVLTTNKIDHGCILFRKAAQHHGATALVIERSPFDSHWLEPHGLFGESLIHDRYARRDPTDDRRRTTIGARIRRQVLSNPDGFRAQSANKLLSASLVVKAPRPHVFLPMDNSLWTGWSQADHPQRRIDYPVYDSPAEAIRHVAKIVKELGGTVILKRHPSDHEVYNVASEANIIIADRGDNETLIKNSDLTVCFLTKLAFVAIAMRARTIVAARNPAALPDSEVTIVSAREHMAEAIKHALANRRPRYDQYDKYFGWLATEYFYQNDGGAGVGLGIEDLMDAITAAAPEPRLLGSDGAAAKAYGKIYSHVRSMARWTHRPTANTSRIHVLLDVSRLANTRLTHTGISRYTRQLIDGLRSAPDVDLDLVLSRPSELTKGEFAGDSSLFSDYLGQAVSEIDDVKAKFNSVYLSPYEPIPDGIRGKGLPAAVFIHDVLHVSHGHLYGRDSSARHINEVLASLRQGQDLILTNSAYSRNEIIRYSGFPADAVFITHLGAADIFHRRDADEVSAICELHGLKPDKYLVIFAQGDPRKNMAGMIAAAGEVLSTSADPDLKCVLLGGGPRLQIVSDLIDQTAVERERFVFVTAAGDDEMAALFSGSRCTLYASLAEGFGLPLLEAMRCGSPVVTSTFTSLPEVGLDAAVYVDPHDPAAIARGVQSVLDSASLRDTLSARGVQIAAHFTEARMVSQTIDALKSWALPPDTTLDATALRQALNEVSNHSDGGPKPSLAQWTCRHGKVVRGNYTGRGVDADRPAIVVFETDTEKGAVVERGFAPPKGVSGFDFGIVLRALDRPNLRLSVTSNSGESLTLDLDLATGKVFQSKASRAFSNVVTRSSAVSEDWILLSVSADLSSGDELNVSMTSRVDGDPAIATTAPAFEAFDYTLVFRMAGVVQVEDIGQAPLTFDVEAGRAPENKLSIAPSHISGAGQQLAKREATYFTNVIVHGDGDATVPWIARGGSATVANGEIIFTENSESAIHALYLKAPATSVHGQLLIHLVLRPRDRRYVSVWAYGGRDSRVQYEWLIDMEEVRFKRIRQEGEVPPPDGRLARRADGTISLWLGGDMLPRSMAFYEILVTSRRGLDTARFPGENLVAFGLLRATVGHANEGWQSAIEQEQV